MTNFPLLVSIIFIIVSSLCPVSLIFSELSFIFLTSVVATQNSLKQFPSFLERLFLLKEQKEQHFFRYFNFIFSKGHSYLFLKAIILGLNSGYWTPFLLVKTLFMKKYTCISHLLYYFILKKSFSKVIFQEQFSHDK